MLMSGCFSSVSQVYRKRDRLDPGGDNRCDGAEHDRGCAYEPRWRRLQVRCRGDSGESRNRASEVLAAMVAQPRVMRAARNATPGTATTVATSPRRIVDPPVGGLGQRRETGCWRSLAVRRAARYRR